MVQMNLFSGREQRCKRRERTGGHSRGRSGWDQQRAALKHAPATCETHSWREAALGHRVPSLGLCEAQEGGLGLGWGAGGRLERGGMYGHSELIHVDVWQKSTQLCKAIIPQSKIIFLKRERSLHSHCHEAVRVFP